MSRRPLDVVEARELLDLGLSSRLTGMLLALADERWPPYSGTSVRNAIRRDNARRSEERELVEAWSVIVLPLGQTEKSYVPGTNQTCPLR